jgi:hypothetical protein
MAIVLNDPQFWSLAPAHYGSLQRDGSLQFILLDCKFKMQPLVRNVKKTFTQFATTDPTAKACKVVVNGNYYDITFSARISVMTGYPDDPSDTVIQGQVVQNGKLIAGDSRPESFWFGQVKTPTKDAWQWRYTAAKGNPPVAGSTLAAIGGVGPMIVDTLPYGVGNIYKPGAPPPISEPATGEPPVEARPYLIQRNNATFVDVNKKPPTTGKTILAYCSAKRTLLVAVQENGVGPGQTHAGIANALAGRGFDTAVFLDGSDSATLIVDGSIVVTPGDRKNETIDVGIGFLA